MLFWWMVAGLLVGEIILLFILLLPLPAILQRAIIGLLDKINKPLYVILAVMCWVLFDSTMEMQKYGNKPMDNTAAALNTENLYHRSKWRAERNFYLAAFTFTLLLILLRCHAMSRKLLDVESERDELLKLRSVNQETKKTK